MYKEVKFNRWVSGLSCFYRLQLEAEISMSSGLVRDFLATSPFRLNVLIIFDILLLLFLNFTKWQMNKRKYRNTIK